MVPKLVSRLVTGILVLITVQQGCQGQRQSQLFRNPNKNVIRSELRLVQSVPKAEPSPPIVSEGINLKDNFSPLLPLCSQDVAFKQSAWIAPRHLVSTNKKATKFEFVTTSLSCKYEMLKVNLPLGAPISTRHRTSYFSLDGYLKHDNQYYPPNEYCVSRLNENRIEVAICTTNCSNPTTPCLQKCCGMNQIYSFGYGDNPRGCVDILPNQPTWYPTLYHDLDAKLTPEELATLHPHIIHKFPTSFKFNCRFNKTTVFPHGKGISDFLSALTHKTFRNLEFRLRKDGWLLYPGEGGSGKGERVAKRIENYCVDGAQDYGESTEFSNLEQETVLFLCSGGVDEAFETPTPTLHPSIPNNAEGAKQDEITRPTSTSTSSPPTTPSVSELQPKPTQPTHLSRFKDRIELDLSDTSSSSSLEIEIEDGVPLNSLEMKPEEDDEGNNSEPDKFIPALLKVSVQVPDQPQPTGLLQTTFNHNNLKEVDSQGSETGQRDSELVPDPWATALPTCCRFDQDVNDGLTHHCRNKRLNDKPQSVDGLLNTSNHTPVEWALPEYFSTRGKSSTFLLRPNPLKCGSGKFQFQGFIHSFEQVLSKTSGDKRHGLLGDGYLKYDHEFYSPEQYCINGLSSRIIEILICKPDCSMWETPCIKKCCGMDEIYNLGLTSGNRGCQPLRPQESKFSPALYKSMSIPVTKEEMGQIQPHFIQKYPPSFQQSCFNKITLAFPYSQEVAEKLTPPNSAERGGTSFKHLRFRFRKDGKLMYSYPESDGTSFDAVFDRAEFCVDSIRDYGENEYFQNNENQTILFICASEPQSAEK